MLWRIGAETPVGPLGRIVASAAISPHGASGPMIGCWVVPCTGRPRPRAITMGSREAHASTRTSPEPSAAGPTLYTSNHGCSYHRILHAGARGPVQLHSPRGITSFADEAHAALLDSIAPTLNSISFLRHTIPALDMRRGTA